MIHVLGDMIKGGIKMSHNKNYNKMYKPNNDKPETKVTPEVEPEVTPEEAVETTPEETNAPEETVASEETPVVEEPAKMKNPYVDGVVTAELLNVREQPNASASVLKVIKKDTKVGIDLDKSNNEWYAVSVGATLGYCMKKFITIC